MSAVDTMSRKFFRLPSDLIPHTGHLDVGLIFLRSKWKLPAPLKGKRVAIWLHPSASEIAEIEALAKHHGASQNAIVTAALQLAAASKFGGDAKRAS